MKLIKKSLLLFILVLGTASFGASNLESSVAEIGKSISQSMLKEGKKKIAIIEFSDLNDNVNDLGRFLAEELINELLKNKKDKGYEIVERRQLNKVLKQLKLSSSGLLEPKSMKEVGKVLNVDSIVTGSLTDLGNDIKVNARIISVESAKIIATASTKIPKVGSVAKLMGQNSLKVSSSSSPTPSKTSTIPHGKYFFENEDILIKYTKISKGYIDGINMVVEYHNKMNKPLSIEIISSYMTNDSGEKS
jgi:TolB-like protein